MGWAGILNPDLTEQKINIYLKTQKTETPLQVYQFKRPDVNRVHSEIKNLYTGFYVFFNIDTLQDNSYVIKLAIENSSSYYKGYYNGEIIISENELQQKMKIMKEFEAQALTEKWLQMGQTFFFHEDLSNNDKDPYSERYKQQQLDLYLSLSKRSSYESTDAEVIKLKIEEHIDPFPYPCSSGDLDHIGNHLLQIGYIYKSLSLKKGDSVLEYGPGGGFTTTLLSASGIDMTAVDINPYCVKIIERIAKDRGLKVSTMVGEFGDVPDPDKKFDAILFYESFHHCINFNQVMKKFYDYTKKDGKILFAGEPVYKDFPKPWGLRLDGQSLYEIINKGWLELGFNEDFFYEMLDKYGWKVEKREFKDLSPIFIATKK